MPLQGILAKEKFDANRTHVICDAFDSAWVFLQKSGSRYAEAAKAPTARAILAKRIIAMAMDGTLDMTQLRDDALAHLQKLDI